MNDSTLPVVSVYFATETCNAEDLSESAASRLEEEGFSVERASVADLEPGELKDKSVVLLIASTWGEGEPPSEAIDFYDGLTTMDPMGLDRTAFSVLALGDTSYEFFCQCGKDLDVHMERHGAWRLHPRVDCDVDYDEPFSEWIDGVVKALREQSIR